MSRKKNRKIADLIKEINETYIAIGQNRDKLRNLKDEAEDIIESIDNTKTSVDEVVMNLEQLDRDLDDVSKFL
jgi:ABC-type transporter Mla subunit MlaD